jgi:hypothetical protein
MDIEKGPIAIIELPFRLRNGIHGSWVDGKDLPENAEFCDMHGISDEIKAAFAPQSLSSGSTTVDGFR